MYLQLVVFLVSVGTVRSKIEVPNFDNDDLLKELYLSNADFNYSTTVFYDLTENGTIPFFDRWFNILPDHFKIKNSFVVLTKDFHLSNKIVATNRIDAVFLDGFGHLNNVFKQNVLTVGRETKLLFVITKKMYDFDMNYVLMFMQEIWKRGVINYSLLLFSKRHGVQDINYNPFTKKLEYNAKDDSKFGNRKFKNLHEAEMKVVMVDDPPRTRYVNGKFLGAAIDVLKLIGQSMNATLKLSEAKDFEVAHVQVSKGLADFCFVGQFYGLYDDVLYSEPIKIDEIVAIVPKAGEVPSHIKLMHVYDPSIWYILGILYVIYLIIIFAIERKDFKMIVLDLFSILLALGIYVNFRKYKPVTNVFFVTWLFFAIIMSLVYSYSMSGALLSKQFYDEITTIQQLIKTNLTVGIERIFIHLLPPELASHVVSMEKEDAIRRILYKQEKMALCCMKTYAEDFRTYLKQTQGDEVYHILEERLIPGFRSYYFNKLSPYITRINELLTIVEESGISNRNNANIRESQYSESSKLTLETVIDAVTIVLVFDFFWFILFLCELFLHKNKLFNTLY